MICTVIDKDTSLGLLSKLEMAELRLDKLQTPLDEIAEIAQSVDIPLIATYRIASDSYKEAREAEAAYLKLIEAGVKYIDVELGFPKSVFKHIQEAADDEGVIIIRSFHNFERCGSLEELKGKVEQCFYHDGEIAKIAVTATCEADMKALKALYSECQEGCLVAFSMGSDYSSSRLDALRLGAPFTYASVGENELGQLTYEEMQEAVYGSLDGGKKAGFKPYEGNKAKIPASKSCAQRAIIMAALSQGESTLEGYTPCDDSEAAIRIIEEWGCTVNRIETGKAGASGKTAKAQTLTINPPSALSIPSTIDVAESGFLARILGPLCAVLTDKAVSITGTGTLANRPLKGLKANFETIGVSYCDTDGHVPYTVSGTVNIKPQIILDGSEGSQQISGIMMALPLAQGCQTTVSIKNPVSSPYLFLTQEIQEKFGVKVADAQRGFKIRGGQHYKAAKYTIEKDWSAAAIYLVAGAIFGSASLGGLKSDSLQADSQIVEILANAGAVINEEGGAINVRRAPLNAFEADLNNCPDLFPLVAILAAFCPGESEIHGTQRLTGKESNRLEAIQQMLAGLGVSCSVKDNALLVTGHSLTSRLTNGNLLQGGSFSSHSDHRMVFALSVAALGAQGKIKIDDTSCVAKSFPGFKL